SCEKKDSFNEARVQLPVGAKGGQLRIVSQLACSVTVPEGVSAASLSFLADDGKSLGTASITVGSDTSEWAYDRSDVQPIIQHRRAAVVSSFEAGNYQGHWYETLKAIPEGDGARSVLIAKNGTAGMLNIQSIDWIGEHGEKVPLQLIPIHQSIAKV